MTSQPGKQTIAIHILSDISRSTDYSQILSKKMTIDYISGSIV